MNTLLGAAAVALIVAAPAQAQLLGGGGGLGGLGGGLGGSVGGTLGGAIDHGRASVDTGVQGTTRLDRQPRGVRHRRGVGGAATADPALGFTSALGERRIAADQSAAANLSTDERLLRTRGAVAASERGMRRVAATSAGVQVFVPAAAVAAPSVTARAYPAYGGGYYYEPGAVFVESSYVDTYVDRQQRDLETSLRGTGTSVTRQGEDLVVMLPADITFAFDKADVRPRFYGVLSTFARTLRDYGGSDVEVVGHTDSVGSDAYNLGLSERRGRSVADFLVQERVEPARLVVEAMGKSEPIASNASIEGRAANRRVELIVHPRAG